MEPTPRICAVVPVYNHGLTVGRVVRGARAHLPVICVDDGSTDSTPEALRAVLDVTVITLERNEGKAAALQRGFSEAARQGYTHAITIDADGQHPVEALPGFIDACRRNPEALITGVRDFPTSGAPWERRFTNGLSNFWFRFETGVNLKDTQCGYRVYPLAVVRGLQVRSARYAYELEILAKASWAGVPLLGHPVHADYAAPTSRLSHFQPVGDFFGISRVHARLTMQAFCLPAPLRSLLVRGALRHLPRGRRLRSILGHIFGEHTETPWRLASAVGVGLFCGIAPIWGGQMIAAAALAHKLRLNKAIALTASNVSFPLAAPFILAAGLVLGNFLWTGQWIGYAPELAARQIPIYFVQWLVGSFLLAILAGGAGLLLAFVCARALGRGGTRPSRNPEP